MNAIRNFCLHHAPGILFIYEPMIRPEAIPFDFWNSCNLRFILSNDRGDLIPNLWLCGGLNVVVNFFSNTEQQITIDVFYRNRMSLISGIYGHTDHIQQKQLWLDLTQEYTILTPWSVMRDFNVVIGAHEKSGGNPPLHISGEEFIAFSDTCDLIHMDTIGAEYT